MPRLQIHNNLDQFQLQLPWTSLSVNYWPHSCGAGWQ